MIVLKNISIHRFRISFLLACTLSVCSFNFAQNTSGQIEIYFDLDTVDVELGSTFTNLLVVNNRGSEPVTIHSVHPLETYPGLLFYPTREMVVQGGEMRQLPVKFIANLDFMKTADQNFHFSLVQTSSSEDQVIELDFTVAKPENPMLAITPFARENYLPYGSEETTITFFVENKSYRPRHIKLEMRSIPDGLQIAPKEPRISLEGLEKQMVEVRILLRNQNLQYPEFQVELKATDLRNEEEVGLARIFVTALSHERQVTPNALIGGYSNFLEMNYNQISSGFNYLQLRGNTEFVIPGNLYTRLNLQTDTYLEQGLYNVYDTWLELEKDKARLRIGNVYGSEYDYSLSGRGGKLSSQFKPNHEMEIMAVENNYNLFGTYFPYGNTAKLIGLKYGIDRPGVWSGKASYIFDHDDRLSINSQVAHFSSTFTGNDRHTMSFHAGLSQEKGLVEDDGQTGGSLGLHYEYRTSIWNFQSSNTLSSRGYTGLSRGTWDINQRLNRELGNNQRLFIGYQNSRIHPRYLSFQGQPDYIRPEYLYSNATFKTGYQRLQGKWNFVFSPQVIQQRTTFGDTDHDFLGYRLYTQLGTSIGRHGINVTAEYTYGNKDQEPAWFHGLRANLIYRFDQFSLHGTLQWNPYNIIELHAYQYEDQNFWNTQLYTAYDFKLWRNRLSGSAAVGLNYSELYRNINNNGRVHLEYKLSPSWSTTGYFNVSDLRPLDFEGYKGYHYQFRVGVKKYFAVSTAPGNHKVSLVVFTDSNFNGRFDEGETVLPHEVVLLDDHVAITDERGRVTFQNVPKGTYTIQVQGKGGSTGHREPIVVDLNTQMEVGLVETIRVTGRLSEVRQKYDRRDTDVRGTVVYARSGDGEVHRTVVNYENYFEFFLKHGEYEIYIDSEQYNFLNPVQTVVLDDHKDRETLVFEYQKKDTSIKVKTF